MFRLCEFYPGICLTTEEKARKNLSQGKKNGKTSATVRKTSQDKKNGQGKKNNTNNIESRITRSPGRHGFLKICITQMTVGK